VPEFAAGTGNIPTTENIAIAIWRRLEGKIPHAKLHRVRVYEMDDLFADYYGEDGRMDSTQRILLPGDLRQRLGLKRQALP
jgi:DNA-binding transcriptional regulator/RsmH inhibitor MraZ